jgi:hypothetical protein
MPAASPQSNSDRSAMYRVGNGITPPSRRILAVLVDQQLRRAEYAGVVDHAIAYIDANLRCQPGFGFGPPR